MAIELVLENGEWKVDWMATKNATAKLPETQKRLEMARNARVEADIKNLKTQLQLYETMNGTAPSTAQGLKALVAKPEGDPKPRKWRQLLAEMPKDPWGQPYIYLNPGLKGEIDIYSTGADGAPGGTGQDADIGSWDP
jgi:general secretion pathway protein G